MTLLSKYILIGCLPIIGLSIDITYDLHFGLLISLIMATYLAVKEL